MTNNILLAIYMVLIALHMQKGYSELLQGRSGSPGGCLVILLSSILIIVTGITH